MARRLVKVAAKMTWFKRKDSGPTKMELDTIDQEANRVANSVHRQVFGEDELNRADRFDASVQEAFLLLMNAMDTYPPSVVRMAVLSYICNWAEVKECDCPLCDSANRVIEFVRSERKRILGEN